MARRKKYGYKVYKEIRVIYGDTSITRAHAYVATKSSSISKDENTDKEGFDNSNEKGEDIHIDKSIKII